MTIEVGVSKVEVRALRNDSKRDLNEFIDVLWKICDQKTYPQWVPPLRLGVLDALDVKKNPFYRRAKLQLYIAYRGGQAVGRIAAIESETNNEFHNEKVGFYGFFECENNEQTASELFRVASEWCASRGLTAMRGPMNPSINHECGLLVRGQSQHPTVMTTWNPKYYQELHEKCGLVGVKDLVAYYIAVDKQAALPPRVKSHVENLQKNSQFKFRELDLKKFDSEVEICFGLYQSAWEKNWGFVPMLRDEFIHMAKDMKLILDPRFALIAEVDGKPAGFMLCLPDINHLLKRIPSGRLFPFGLLTLLLGRRFLKTVRVVTLGVKPEFRGSGIFALFTHEAFRRAREYGIVGGDASWILEDNVEMNKPWQDLGAPLYRRWRIYEKPVAQTVPQLV